VTVVGLTQSESENDARNPLDTRRNFHPGGRSGSHVDLPDGLAYDTRNDGCNSSAWWQEYYLSCQGVHVLSHINKIVESWVS
jgi:hypothetical protein